jgi:predicted metal-binding membrane protein
VTATVALRRASWHHPEAVAAGAAGAAWVLLLVPELGGRGLHDRAHDALPLLAGAAGWLTMATAMMVPGVLLTARALGLGALWERRQRTVGLFLAGYLGVWAAFGAVVLPLVAVTGAGPGVLAATLALAAAWELTPWKWRRLRACHLVAPLPPRGRRADVACARAGLRYGARCAGACWPLMLAMAVAGHASLGLMALLTAIVVAEKATVRSSRLAVPVSAILAAAALAAALAV